MAPPAQRGLGTTSTAPLDLAGVAPRAADAGSPPRSTSPDAATPRSTSRCTYRPNVPPRRRPGSTPPASTSTTLAAAPGKVRHPRFDHRHRTLGNVTAVDDRDRRCRGEGRRRREVGPEYEDRDRTFVRGPARRLRRADTGREIPTLLPPSRPAPRSTRDVLGNGPPGSRQRGQVTRRTIQSSRGDPSTQVRSGRVLGESSRHFGHDLGAQPGLAGQLGGEGCRSPACCSRSTAATMLRRTGAPC